MFSFVFGTFVGTFITFGLMVVMFASKCESDKERESGATDKSDKGE